MLKMGEQKNSPIVFLHGFMGSPSDWLPVIKVLSQHFYCLCPDLPGHTETLVEMSDSPSRQVEILIQSITESTNKRFHLVGYSLGGRIALMIASQWPSLIRSLTLESAHPGLPSESERKQRKLADERWAAKFKQQPLSSTLDEWFTQTVYESLSPQAKSIMIDSILERAGKTDRCALQLGVQAKFHNRMATVLMAFSLSKQESFSAALKNAVMPIHYISGELDEKYSKLGAQLALGSRSVQHQVFAHCGHNVHRQRPWDYAQLLFRQLAL